MKLVSVDRGLQAGACSSSHDLLDSEPLSNSCSHTLFPLNVRHIPLTMTLGSLRELEGHEEIGVKVNLKALHEVQ